MNSLDYLIVGIYAVVLIAIATYVSLSKKGEKKGPRERAGRFSLISISPRKAQWLNFGVKLGPNYHYSNDKCGSKPPYHKITNRGGSQVAIFNITLFYFLILMK